MPPDPADPPVGGASSCVRTGVAGRRSSDRTRRPAGLAVGAAATTTLLGAAPAHARTTAIAAGTSSDT